MPGIKFISCNQKGIKKTGFLLWQPGQDMAYVINDPGFDFDNVSQRKTSQRLTSQITQRHNPNLTDNFTVTVYATSNKTIVTENEKLRCAIYNSHK